jgi:hypothetical protein
MDLFWSNPIANLIFQMLILKRLGGLTTTPIPPPPPTTALVNIKYHGFLPNLPYGKSVTNNRESSVFTIFDSIHMTDNEKSLGIIRKPFMGI